MNQTFRTIITGTGSYIPDRIVPNAEFLNRLFLGKDGTPFEKSNKETIQKFSEITGIEERRFADDSILASDMGARAAENALTMSGLDRETLDYIIVAHNFGDVRADNPRPVTFWFYSESEQNIYKLAAHLNENGYTILTCEKSFNGQFLCIAERVFCTTEEKLNRLWVYMQILAEKMGVTYDGSETRIDLE